LIGKENAVAGEIGNNIHNLISRSAGHPVSDQDMLLMLTMMSHGMRAQIDSRTHQRGWRRVILLTYFFLAAQPLQDWRPEEATESILIHLEEAQKTLQAVYGQMEIDRLTQMGATLPILEPGLKPRFEEVLGVERTNTLATTSLSEISANERLPIATVLGWKMQNEIYRNILLSTLSELWVDYLTRIEAVRVSISLEAYAQRDPLVQYKSKATDLFKTLLSEIRQGVISRMFLLQPRRATQPTQPGSESPRAIPSATGAGPEIQNNGADKKRKRHRH
jgi:preprotein translocase subunit SecA